MDSENLQILPNPPSLMKSLMAGFDAISKHIELIFFSIALDLILWFSPRVRLNNLIQSLGELTSLNAGANDVDMLERLADITTQINLLSSLRTFPVGIPSLMASRPPAANPIGTPMEWELPSFLVAIGLWTLVNIVGLLFGTLYFKLVAQAVMFDGINWRLALGQWPWASLQVIILTFFLFVLLSVSIFPFLCIFSFILASGLGLEQFVLFGMVIFGLLWVWFLLPFLYSPHGIFGPGVNAWQSLRKSARLTRATLPSTALLLLTIIVFSEGLRKLWTLPPDGSWWLLVGIAGHAFITTSLLAATFIFYKDSDLWVQQVFQKTGIG